MNRIFKLAQILNDIGLEEEAEAVEDLATVDWEQELGQEPLSEEPSEKYEEEYFQYHFDLLKGLTDAANRELSLKKFGPFKVLGWGNFRKVFQVPGRYDYIIKVAYGDEGLRGTTMNKAEFELQQTFEGLFPRVFKHGSSNTFGTDFDWMIIERVMPLRNQDELNKFFPYIHKIINIDAQRPLDVYDFFWDYYNVKEGRNQMNKYHLPLSRIIKYALRKEPLFKSIVDISNETGLVIADMKPENVGKTYDGKFVIIDASILGKDLAKFK